MTEVPQANKQFPVLDTMRAVGALAVLTTHVGFNAGIYSGHGAIGRLIARMDVGVAVFFVLSGFLLSRPWLVASTLDRRRPGIRRYAWKRFLRIVPAYTAVALVALTVIASNRDRGPWGWMKSLALADIYASERLPYGLTQTWSLATEVAFYIALPAIMWLAVGKRGHLRTQRVALALLGMALVNVFWLLAEPAWVLDNSHVNEWLPAYLTWFAAGIGLALVDVSLGRHARVRAVVDALAGTPGSCWVIALGLLLIAGTSVAGPTALVPATQTEALTKNLLYAMISTLIVIPGVFGPADGRYVRVMSHNFLRHLGHISYGIFLVHMSVLHFVMWMTGYELFYGHFLQIFVLTLAISVAAAEVLYRVVELPCMRLKDLGRRTSATAPTAPESATSTR